MNQQREINMQNVHSKVEELVKLADNFDKLGDNFDPRDVKKLNITPSELKMSMLGVSDFDNAIKGMVEIAKKPTWSEKDLDMFDKHKWKIVNMVGDNEIRWY